MNALHCISGDFADFFWERIAGADGPRRFRCPGRPIRILEGDRIYTIQEGRILGSHKVIKVHSQREEEEKKGRKVWPGTYLTIDPGSWIPLEKILNFEEFRGVRYVDKLPDFIRVVIEEAEALYPC